MAKALLCAIQVQYEAESGKSTTRCTRCTIFKKPTSETSLIRSLYYHSHVDSYDVNAIAFRKTAPKPSINSTSHPPSHPFFVQTLQLNTTHKHTQASKENNLSLRLPTHLKKMEPQTASAPATASATGSSVVTTGTNSVHGKKRSSDVVI